MQYRVARYGVFRRPGLRLHSGSSVAECLRRELYHQHEAHK